MKMPYTIGNHGETIIPTSLLLEKSIPDKAKILYGIMRSFMNVNGFCFASNEYFAEQISLKPEEVQALIDQLENIGYISCEIEKKKFKDFRRIFLSSEYKKALKAKSEKFIQEIETAINKAKK